MGIGDGSHTVGDDKHGLVAYQLRDACLYLGLVLDVEAGSSFVEQHDWGVFEQSTGDRYALTFATRECGAVLADERVVALGHTADELVATSQLCHTAYLLVGGVGLADTDIVGDARVEQQHVLEYHRIVFEQCLGVYLRDVLPAESDCALIDIPETCGELGGCALASARRTYQRRYLALPSGKRHVTEHLLACLVREVDSVECYIVVIDRIIGCSLLYGHRLHLFYSVDMHVENSQYCNVIEYLTDRIVDACRYHQEDKVGKHIYCTDRQ